MPSILIHSIEKYLSTKYFYSFFSDPDPALSYEKGKKDNIDPNKDRYLLQMKWLKLWEVKKQKIK